MIAHARDNLRWHDITTETFKATYDDLIDLVRAFAAPEWQDEPPTAPGYYWTRGRDEKGMGDIVEITERGGELYEQFVDSRAVPLGGSLGDFWSGPLLHPPEPREEDGE